MKKLILVLAILVVAAPAFAVLDVNLVLCANDVNIVYTGGDPCNLPRAFALKIELVGGTDPCIVIKDVNDYKKNGESTSASKGYGIYPATIAIDSCGVVNSWGSPLADPNDPGGSKALPSKTIILELGSLYAPVHDWVNAPDPCGILCELHFDCNGSNGNVNIRMTDEDTYRGGVVLEDGTTVDVNKTLLYTPCVAAQPPSKCLKSTIPDQNEWNGWVQFGEPNCWCFKRQCRGDSNGGKLGAAWVASNDLNLLKRALSKNDTCLATISYSGVPGICADFDHKKQGAARVGSFDLNIMKKYLSQPEVNVPCCDYNAPGTAPDCNLRPPADPNEKYNFWQVK
jgi:hypothetical protein